MNRKRSAALMATLAGAPGLAAALAISCKAVHSVQVRGDVPGANVGTAD